MSISARFTFLCFQDRPHILIFIRSSTDTGMSRLSLSDSDKEARDWLVETTKALGCRTVVDSMGNIFAIRAGLKGGPPTFAGSHLDTQPSGTCGHSLADV